MEIKKEIHNMYFRVIPILGSGSLTKGDIISKSTNIMNKA